MSLLHFDETMKVSVCVDRDAQQDNIKDLDGTFVEGQTAKTPRTRSQSRRQAETISTSYPASSSSSPSSTSSITSTWRAHSPPGSFMSIIRTHPQLRLYVDPLLWTPRHPQLLKVSVSVSETTPTRPHRPTCPKCNSCGKVPSSVFNLLQSYPYRTEKDRNLTRLVRNAIESLRTSSGASLFKTSKQHQLPFSFGGKRQCWVVQPLIVQDISSGTPLVAFTHESGRCDAFDDRFPRCAGTIKAKARSVATMISGINPHDVAVLIAMAQEAQRVQSKSKSKSQDQRAVLFTPTLIAPTPDRDALYVYRACISPDYLESFTDIHKPLESEMRIFRATIPFDDTAILLETLGQVLDIHQRLETATKPIMAIEKENRTQKRAIDAEGNRHPKRQRHSQLPLAHITAPNVISGS